MRIDPGRSAALLIDYQEKLIPAQYNGDLCVENTVKLATGLMALGIDIIASTQYSRGLGDTVAPIRDLPGYPAALDKKSFSCMGDEGIVSALKATGAKNIIVCGVETHICLLQTVIDLIEAGFTVYLVADCSTSRTEAAHLLGLERAKQEGAFITSLEAILFEILGSAGSEHFKTISNLIK